MGFKEFVERNIILLVCLMVSSMSIGQLWAQPEDIEGNVESRIVSANTEFGFGLFHEILKEGRERNVIFSPLSVSIALAMVYNGAGGETKDAMEKVLKLSGIPSAQVNESYLELQEVLENPDPQVQINIANSLWGNMKVRFKPDFLKRNRDYYRAELKLLIFNEAAPRLINKWVERKTDGKITKIVDRIDPNTILFLINAIYFKGKWTTTFDEKKTEPRDFILPDGTVKRVPMMKREGNFMYLESEKFQAVSLPYGKEKRISMYLFLPNKESNLREFSQSLNKATWEEWMKRFAPREGEVVLPRFRMEFGVDLRKALALMGMGVAFDEAKANFENLCYSSNRVFLQGVKHKAFIEVNEEGTEAAAVTSVRVGITSVPQRFKMVLDRPFFFAIRDNQTGSILFMGRVTDPVE